VTGKIDRFLLLLPVQQRDEVWRAKELDLITGGSKGFYFPLSVQTSHLSNTRTGGSSHRGEVGGM
jgi:hypothetical protein